MVGHDAAEAAVTRAAERRVALLPEKELRRQQRAGLRTRDARARGAGGRKKKQRRKPAVRHDPGLPVVIGVEELRELEGAAGSGSSSSGDTDSDDDRSGGGHGDGGDDDSSGDGGGAAGMEVEEQPGSGGGVLDPLEGYSVERPPPVHALPLLCAPLFALAASHGVAPREMAQRLLRMGDWELRAFTSAERSGV
jgi:hypothetical protein